MDFRLLRVNFSRLFWRRRAFTHPRRSPSHETGVDLHRRRTLRLPSGIIATFNGGHERPSRQNTASICRQRSYSEIPVPLKTPATGATFTIAPLHPPKLKTPPIKSHPRAKRNSPSMATSTASIRRPFPPRPRRRTTRRHDLKIRLEISASSMIFETADLVPDRRREAGMDVCGSRARSSSGPATRSSREAESLAAESGRQDHIPDWRGREGPDVLLTYVWVSRASRRSAERIELLRPTSQRRAMAATAPRHQVHALLPAFHNTDTQVCRDRRESSG